MSASRRARNGTGCLYLVATPIGNLEDITLRALRILKEADLVACEDTRQTQKLLKHYGLRKRLVSYHEHNEMTRAPELIIELEQGARVALVSDAGMPVISDPGHRLVSLCLRHHIPIVPVPGATALVASLAASGLPSHEFLFVGFLPARAGERREALARLAAEPRTLVLFEAPHRIEDSLRDALEVLGPRPAVLAREVTKLHEEFLRGSVTELLERVRRKPPKGEMTLLIGTAATPAALPKTFPLTQRIEQIMHEQNLDHKAALKMAARERGLNKRDAYRQLLMERR